MGADDPVSHAGDPDREVSDAGPAHAARAPRWRKPALIGAAALVCLLAVAGGTYAATHKTVTITVDGTAQEVSTLSGSVAGALDAAGLTVSEHDSLAPGADDPISDGSQIALQRGRLLTLTVDGQTRQVWTTATTVEQALADLGQNPSAFKLSADRARAIPIDGLSRDRADPAHRHAHQPGRSGGHGQYARPPPSARCWRSRASRSGRPIG